MSYFIRVLLSLLAAQCADYIIAVMGINDTLEGGGHDRKATWYSRCLIWGI